MTQKLKVPYKSFVKNLIKRYFITKEFIKAFCISILLSNFIYLDIFANLFLEFISPFLAIFGFFLLLNSSRICYFWSGFFVGLFWFYWITYSLLFYGFAYLIPLELILICAVYGVLFLICGFWPNLFIRGFFLLILSFIHPFGFNWLNLELTLIHGIFEPNLRGLFFVLLSAILFHKLPKFRFLSLFLLIFSLQFSQNEPKFADLKINLAQTEISQDIKWAEKNRDFIVKSGLNLIDEAIANGDELVVLPESSFPVILNDFAILSDFLKQKSHQISILAGSFATEFGQIYNSSFLFENGEISRFDKVFLVPFGEEIPLPNFMRKLINDIFYDGAQDFGKAPNFSDFSVKNERFRSTICYEITREEAYKNAPQFLIAITNNAWFMPSTEPNLQRILIKYFATKHAKTVYHSVNGSASEIIVPKELWVKKALNLD